MKNVLYLSGSSGIGGAESFLKSTALYHDRDRFRPKYLLFQDGPFVEWLDENGFDYYVTKSRPRLSSPLSWMNLTRAEFGKVDILHSTMAYGELFGFPLSLRLRSKNVWYQHGPVSGWMDRVAGLYPSDAVYFNSEFTKEAQLQYKALFKSHHVHTLGLCFDPISNDQKNEFKKSFFERHQLDPNKPVLGMLTRLQEWKGVDIFIHAFEKVAANHDVQGIIVGAETQASKSTEYQNNVSELASRVGIRVLPPEPDPREALSSLDILVNASRQPEPFGLTIIEAMASGVVPIAPAWGGPLEILTDFREQLLFEPQSPLSLAEKIQNLLSNPDPGMKEALTTFSKNKYNGKTSISEIESYYDMLFE